MDLVLKGLGRKTVSVTGDSVKIEKSGLLTSSREKTLPIRNISSVEVKRPGFAAGFIQFSIAGGKSLDSSFKFTGGAHDAARDENSVVFSGEANYEIALRIKAYVESWSSTRASGNASTSDADEIRKLKALLDDGVLTQAEFDHKKRKLLGL
jgi:hypothetical protein